jgi:hypothetical protein
MSIQDLINHFEIQGAFRIKEYDWEKEDCIVLTEGHDFECEYYDIDDSILNSNITYMYVVDNVLNIEVS